MSDGIRGLKKKLRSIHSLQSLIKTIKILSAMRISSYQQAVEATTRYSESIELGMMACLRSAPWIQEAIRREEVAVKTMGVIIFGTDQGMVGSFNDQICDYMRGQLASTQAKTIVWAVGQRLHWTVSHIPQVTVRNSLQVPTSVTAIAHLISQILEAIDSEGESLDRLQIFYNAPGMGASYTPTSCNLLPLDVNWLDSMVEKKWPTNQLPEVIGDVEEALTALIREFLFLSIFRACAASLASENASRLALMQVAEKRIDEMMESVTLQYHKNRQALVDEELFSRAVY